MGEQLGLIAGDGLLPLEIARAARQRGRRVIAVGFHDLTRSSLEEEVDELCWLRLGQIGAMIDAFCHAGVRDVVMAGKVSKVHLFQNVSELRPDRLSLEILAELRDRRDDSLLASLARALEARGLVVRPQTELIPELLAGLGPLGNSHPTALQWADIRFGWSVAKAMALLDVGQSVVVKERAVLAVEAIEGTDAAIRRGAGLGGPGVCVVKVAKPAQDPRFDLPAVGPGTLSAMREAGARVLAFEAHRTIVLERAELVRQADADRIAVVGVLDPAGEAR